VKCLLSIIVPVYNEQENIAPLFARLGTVIERIRAEFGLAVEVIVNDNNSSDGTLLELQHYAERHDETRFDLRIYRFARNIGFQKSILVGYCKAHGDVVAQVDADLQDPPELLVEFLHKWHDGFKVVYGIRRRRQEGAVTQSVRRLFYRVIDRISEDDLPHDSGDFRLIDRSLIDVICSLRDHNPYLRGSVASLGLKQIGIPYDRTERQHGKSKFGFFQLTRLAVDGITNHSAFPLRLASYIALLVVILGVLLIVYYLGAWIFGHDGLPAGFLTQTLLQLGTLATVSFLIAIQGFYIHRIYNQVKERPLAIVEYKLQKGASLAGKSKLDEEIEVVWAGHTPARKRVS
jgi:polyisoprenyl-phosphate glycosyltransferase